ncbi:MAG TPA: insulinase family protein, partial [Thermodesulfobacteriota bacterium]|nr:insulinase family protein [Thermodesulfobacteriota bacterium]
KTFDQEIERLQRERVGEKELEKAMNQLEASFIFGQDSIFNQAMLLARHEIALSWKIVDDYLPSIRKVTPEDIQRVAKKYLIPENRTVGILIPLPPKEGKPLPSGDDIKGGVVR